MLAHLAQGENSPFHPDFGPYSARPFRKTVPHFMSQHRSLTGQSTIAAKRNVLKRFERVEVLKARGQFKLGDKVIGLRKTKPNE
jgi:small basic protein (TIGR04137 family)